MSQTRSHTALEEMPSAPPAPDDDRQFLARLGQRVRKARESRGQSRKVVAKRAAVSERYLAQLELGEGNASIVLLRRVAAALGVSVVELLGGEASLERRLIVRFLERLPRHRLEDVVFRLMRDFGQEQAERKRRIALIGLRGAGKSTLGQMLAQQLGVPFVELGREIEREAGMKLSEVFMLYGQQGYRRLERRCLEKTIERHETGVIAAGGGIVSAEEAFNLLLLNCYTVWLRAAPEEHMTRVIAQGDFRPMSGSDEALEDLRRILSARESLYRKADTVVDTSGASPEETLTKLHQAVLAC